MSETPRILCGAFEHELTQCQQELERVKGELLKEIKNKKEFERDWLGACDSLYVAEAKVKELESALREREAGMAALHSVLSDMVDLFHGYQGMQLLDAKEVLKNTAVHAKAIAEVVEAAEKQANLHGSVARSLQDDGMCQCDICKAVRALKGA